MPSGTVMEITGMTSFQKGTPNIYIYIYIYIIYKATFFECAFEKKHLPETQGLEAGLPIGQGPYGAGPKAHMVTGP